MTERTVRTAWAADATAIGEVQARAWTASYGRLLPGQLLAEIDATAFGQAWEQAITRPPTAKHRVLVAMGPGDRVVGFTATAPSEEPDAEPGLDGQLVVFHIDPDALRQGHGSRLLQAGIDTLRADGFGRAYLWLLSKDDDQRRFFESAGWAADGAYRTLDLAGDGESLLNEVRLHTDLRPAEGALGE